MEPILIFLGKTAPTMFYSLLALILFSKAYLHLAQHLTNKYRLQGQQLEEEINQLKKDHAQFMDSLDEDGRCSHTCGECQITEFNQRIEKLSKASRKFTISIKVLNYFVTSPLGQLFFFLGNTDSLSDRRLP